MYTQLSLWKIYGLYQKFLSKNKFKNADINFSVT